MKRIELDLTVQEAEEILIALSFRHKQCLQEKAHANVDEINELGEKCSREFERKLGADAGWWSRHRDKDFRVKITSPKVVYR